MNAADKEAVRGLLLTTWLEDLRHDRAPQLLPEMDQLSDAEQAEVLELARFWKATLYPTPATEGEVNRVRARLREGIQQKQREAQQMALALASDAATFGEAVGAVRRRRQINTGRLEAALSMASGTLDRLETTEVPPHRLPIDTVRNLLRALDLASSQIVELVRQTSLAWAQHTYTRPGTQLGRLGFALDPDERRQLLEGDQAVDQAGLAQEQVRIDQYCAELAAGLN